MNGGQHSSLTARDGSFAFRDVTAGVYLLEVLSPNFHYSAVKIKVDDKTGIIAIEYKVLPAAASRRVAARHVLVADAAAAAAAFYVYVSCCFWWWWWRGISFKDWYFFYNVWMLVGRYVCTRLLSALLRRP